MKKYYIFLDTNIIQHTLTYQEKDKLIWLHKLNAEFYNAGNLYILPQVITELNEFDPDVFGFTKHEYSFVDLFVTEILNDAFEFHTSFFKDSLENISLLDRSKITWYKEHIADTFLFLESMYQSTFEWVVELQKIKKLFEEKGWVIIDQNCKDNYSQKLAKLIEGTWLGDMSYRGFTYRDIFRSTGNFMFDYKRFRNKWDVQKWKVVKDALVMSEIILWTDFLWITPGENNIVFISSDFGFLNEIKKIKEDCLIWWLLETEHYKWLSDHYIKTLQAVISNFVLIKLYPDTCIFENPDKAQSYKILELL